MIHRAYHRSEHDQECLTTDQSRPGRLPRIQASSKAGGIRFAEEHATTAAAASAHSHVHFDEKLHDSVVMVIPEADGNFLVKVGFLKTQHKYEIVFTLPEVPSLGRDVCPAPVPSPHLQIKEITAASDDRHHGTPMFLEGVRCIGAELEYDSEQSDWQGFD
ncbi:hypothetical protein P4O66_008641 [Electrophorus voltai]|uniref:Adipose-secreted signaling protein n=1 Tax=Electrophorus voltai TaxID=2609070 RepID=A0AAD9DY38_9TELE|nr:hypothetical protein P4O66_008641 [Electrophorus voltai]